jgi:PAS domain S-box-containing protein
MTLRNAEYALLVEQSPMIIWRANPGAKCDYFNERWLSFTGRTLEQELGDGWAEGVHPDDLQRCVGIWLGAFAARVPFEMEYRLRRHDGVYRWILDRGAPCYGDGGAFVGFIGNCVDVSERVEAQQVLAAQHARELDQLRGLLPICSCCKNIRDEAGRWQRLEAYITERSSADFTHTYCPRCYEKAFGAEEETAPPIRSTWS